MENVKDEAAKVRVLRVTHRHMSAPNIGKFYYKYSQKY